MRTSRQHLGDVEPALPGRPGSCEKIDDEYEREGVSNVFMACEPATLASGLFR